METTLLQLFLAANIFLVGIIATIAYQHARAHFKPHAPIDLPQDTKTRLTHDAEASLKRSVEESAAELKEELHATTKNMGDMLQKLVTFVINDEMEKYRVALRELHERNESTLKDSLTDTTAQHIELKTKLLKKQAQLDASLSEYQTKLETDLKDHQAEIRKKLDERQAELSQLITDHQKQFSDQQSQAELAITAQQQQFQKQLNEHQQAFSTALTERQHKLADYQSAIETELTEYKSRNIEQQKQFEGKLALEIATKKDFLSHQIDTRLSDAIVSFLSENLGSNIDLGAQTTYITGMLEKHKDELKKEISDVS